MQHCIKIGLFQAKKYMSHNKNQCCSIKEAIKKWRTTVASETPYFCKNLPLLWAHEPGEKISWYSSKLLQLLRRNPFI